MADFQDIVQGTPKTYFYEKHLLVDSKGNSCVIRCSFNKDRFLLRSTSFVENSEDFKGDKCDKLISIDALIVGGSTGFKENSFSGIKE